MRSLIAATLALLASSDALACGGFFCSSVQQPVDQAGERILFVVDEDDETIEVHVQITYQGTAEAFAWILPTPTQPVLETTVDDVFQILGQQTFPLWQVTQVTEGTCRTERAVRGGDDAMQNDTDAAAVDDTAGGPGGVRVASEGLVGPYEQVVLQADDASVLVEWLQARGYYVPDDIGPELEPYVAEESWFVALRLQKGRTSGDLVPVKVTYPGTEPQIPLRLTSIAATPDMPLQPFVLGRARAVPENYLHVTVNPFAVDWINGGANWFQVITRAANEAGGQGFATDASGSTEPLRGLFFEEGRYRPALLRQGAPGRTDALEALDFLQQAGFPFSSGVLAIVESELEPPLPPDVDLATMLGNLGYYDDDGDFLDGYEVDPHALADRLEAEWIPAMEHVEALVREHPVITRMTSSISADEMTVDPLFVLNPDLPRVDRTRSAELVTHCSSRYTVADAPRALRLPDGRELFYPPEAFQFGFDWTTWLASINAYATETIEQTGRSGAPLVVADHRDAIDEMLARLAEENGGRFGRGGCGCDVGGGVAMGAGALATLLAGLRRRRR